MACQAKLSKACGDGGTIALMKLIWECEGYVQANMTDTDVLASGGKVCNSGICPQMRLRFRGLNDGEGYIQ